MRDNLHHEAAMADRDTDLTSREELWFLCRCYVIALAIGLAVMALVLVVART